jgi:hypothetical protein
MKVYCTFSLKLHLVNLSYAPNETEIKLEFEHKLKDFL